MREEGLSGEVPSWVGLGTERKTEARGGFTEREALTGGGGLCSAPFQLHPVLAGAW